MFEYVVPRKTASLPILADNNNPPLPPKKNKETAESVQYTLPKKTNKETADSFPYVNSSVIACENNVCIVVSKEKASIMGLRTAEYISCLTRYKYAVHFFMHI